ncbi:MAG: GNAT family protein [Betaproteobacteria bacterium]
MPSRSMGRAPQVRRRGFQVYLRAPRKADAPAFLAAVSASRKLHGKWVHPPSTPSRFAEFVRRFGRFTTGDPMTATHAGFLVCRCSDDAMVGAFNLSEIVHGVFRSAYLGYYAFAPHAGAGYMSEGLELTLEAAFRVLKLHRVEANIQPTNLRSLTLANDAGFLREGFSRRYMRIAGRWRDHARLALLVEDWRARRKRRA